MVFGVGYTWLDPQKTSYSYGDRALFGPWLDSFMHPGGRPCPLLVFGGGGDLNWGGVVAITIPNIRCGGCSLYQVPAMGVATHHDETCLLCCALAIWRAQVAAFLLPATLVV